MTRTIDADALINTLNEKNIPVDVRVNYQIMNAPTIELDGDTISRSRAIKDISEWATDILHPDKLIKEDAIHILESLPSADVVEVVRCKDCKWYDDKGKGCNRSGGLTMYPLHEYDHCSYVERREP